MKNIRKLLVIFIILMCVKRARESYTHTDTHTRGFNSQREYTIKTTSTKMLPRKKNIVYVMMLLHRGKKIHIDIPGD